MNFNKIADQLILKLNALGVGCYIWCRATTGSVYIRFEDVRMGSIRLGDHDGKDKLKYKFNIRSDWKGKNLQWLKDGEQWRLYIKSNEWESLIPILVKRAEDVKGYAPSRYNYGIPKFMLKDLNKSK